MGCDRMSSDHQSPRPFELIIGERKECDEEQGDWDEGQIQVREHTVNPNIEYHPHDYKYNHSSGPVRQLFSSPHKHDKMGKDGEYITDVKEESPFTTSQPAYDISFKGIRSIYHQ